MTSIGNRAFYNCTSLTSIVVPASMKGFFADVFSNCKNLKEVYYMAESNIMDRESHRYYANATKYYYSETPPTTNHKNYWHYVDSVPTVWTKP
jgi:hypothetical protein